MTEVWGFEWDADKAHSNAINHGVTFEEAASVFDDPYARQYDDPDHSTDQEDRFILVGAGWSLRVLVVVHCERPLTGNIRIISARKAVKSERYDYDRRKDHA